MEGARLDCEDEGQVFETVPRWAQCGHGEKRPEKGSLEDIPRAIKQRRNGMPSRNSIRFVRFLNSMRLKSGSCSRCETFYDEQEDTLPASLSLYIYTKI